MKPETVRAATAILGSDDLIGASVWADGVVADRPASAGWHTVPIPAAATAYQRQRDCSGRDHDGCVVEALFGGERALGVERRLSLLSATQVRERLEFYLNLIGEIHDPLNCIDNGDHGGRDVHVRLPGTPAAAPLTDLRALWDVGLIEGRGQAEDEYAARLEQDIAAQSLVAGSLSPVDWAQDSHAVALKVAYAYPGFAPGRAPRSVVTLDRAYLDVARTAVDRQLELAGLRLARMLDAVLN
jgi:hypothetical protein